MAYIDGFLLPVPKKHLAAYAKMSRKAGKVWKEHGALEFRECVADDLTSMGPSLFPKMAGLKKGEVVVFSWIAYKSRADRARVLAKVLKDKRLQPPNTVKNKMPFDPDRMAYGGFKPIVTM